MARYNSEGVAPHAETSRATYTVPAGRIGLVGPVSIYVRRNTVAAPVGWIKILVRYDEHVTHNLRNLAELWTKMNVADNERRLDLSVQVWLYEGDMVDIRTTDLGTGGTNDYLVSALVNTFELA
jgi:hypothetical protein